MVLHCIFIKKPVDVCKKSPPPYGAKNQHVSLAQENHCFYFFSAPLVSLGQENHCFLLCLFSLGQENQCFYCVFGTTSELAPRKPMLLCVCF